MSSNNCLDCGVSLTVGKNWTKSRVIRHEYRCRSCHSKAHNASHMYVNGKYIPMSHPLHRPGRYKTFGDVAFDNMMKGKGPEGYVYIITNPAHPEWVKVGMAVDAQDRLNGYQTSSPHRDFEMYASYEVTDRRAAEAAAHKILKSQYSKANEWFQCSPEAADLLIRGTMEEFSEDYYDEDDGQPDERQEWYDFDPDC